MVNMYPRDAAYALCPGVSEGAVTIASRVCPQVASRKRLGTPQAEAVASVLPGAAAQAGDTAAATCPDKGRGVQGNIQQAHACQVVRVPHVLLEVVSCPLETVAERAPVSCLGGTKLLQCRQHPHQAACPLGITLSSR